MVVSTESRSITPLPGLAIDVEVGASFMPQTHSHGSQRAERRWHRKIKQQLKKIGEELRHRHRVDSLLNALSLRDKALGHATKPGDHQEGDTGDAPTQIATATLEIPPCNAEARNRDHRRNYVAAQFTMLRTVPSTVVACWP